MIGAGRIQRDGWTFYVGNTAIDIDELRTQVMPNFFFNALVALDPPMTKDELDFVINYCRYYGGWVNELLVATGRKAQP